MQPKLKIAARIAVFASLVCLLAMIRAFEDVLFYDPFLAFFSSEFAGLPLPEFDGAKLAISLFFRYSLNTLMSLVILYVIFRDVAQLKFAALLYVVFFVILLLVFFGIIYMYENHQNLLLFYVRRFIIQPVFVILFIPAFYYQERIGKK